MARQLQTAVVPPFTLEQTFAPATEIANLRAFGAKCRGYGDVEYLDVASKRGNKGAAGADEPRSVLKRATDLTFGFLRSLLGQVTAYAAAITGAVLAFQKVETHLQGLPRWASLTIILAPLGLSLVLHTIPTLIGEYRVKQLIKITTPPRQGYFSLAPRIDSTAFTRSDHKHDEILKWIEAGGGKILYLTGLSGSGKSSIISAYVLPRFDGAQGRALLIRGYQDPVNAIRAGLVRPGAVWQSPPREDLDVLSLLSRAARYIAPQPLLIVLDQFEECLILQSRAEISAVESLVATLRTAPIANLTLVLVFRSDYTGLIGNYALPPLNQNDNWQEIPPFTENAAHEFMMGSGMSVSDELMHSILREAAEIDQTKGLIRPITINLCGLVLARFRSGVPRDFRSGSLIRGFLRESLMLPAIREVTPRVIPQLIADSTRRVQRTVQELAARADLNAGVIRGCMYVLGDSNRAIVKAINREQTLWEISHDFLVPLIDSIVARWYISAWRRSRPLLPWFAAAVLLIAFGLISRQPPDKPRVGHLSPLHAPDAGEGGALAMSAVPPARDGRAQITLASVLGPFGEGLSRKIEDNGKIIFQAAGSTGEARESGVPVTTQTVANRLLDDFRNGDEARRPSFLLLLGDQVLYHGEKQYYYSEFYSPYVQYPAPILALAGNHEGAALGAFLENFCAPSFHVSAEAEGIDRTAQIEPGVYFRLDAPFVRLLALYSNRSEGGGVLSSEDGKYPEVGDAQLRFLERELTRIRDEKYSGAVLVAFHHDIYRATEPHPVLSPGMRADLDAVFRKTGVWPHAVVSGHAHVYARFTRQVGGIQVAYVTAGNGGYGTHYRARALPPQSRLDLGDDDVTLNSYDSEHFGYLRVSVDKTEMRIEYHPVSSELGSTKSMPIGDAATVDLRTHRISQ